MSDSATQRIVDSVERTTRQLERSNPHPKVKIVTEGIRKLVYINGQRIDGVLSIDIPTEAGEFGPSIKLHLLADEIVLSVVSVAEYRQIVGG